MHLTKFPGHADSIFIAKDASTGPLLHMLCAVRHVSYSSERKGGQTKEEKCDVIPDAMHLRFVPGLLSI